MNSTRVHGPLPKGESHPIAGEQPLVAITKQNKINTRFMSASQSFYSQHRCWFDRKRIKTG
jgi:hypothetical protein